MILGKRELEEIVHAAKSKWKIGEEYCSVIVCKNNTLFLCKQQKALGTISTNLYDAYGITISELTNGQKVGNTKLMHPDLYLPTSNVDYLIQLYDYNGDLI